PFISGAMADKQQVATAVGLACEQVGFFTITGHGVPLDLIHTTYATAQQFFDLPLVIKLQVRTTSGCGYIPMEAENLAGTVGAAAPEDLKESFNVSSRLAQNVWPEQPATLEPIGMAYFQAMEGLAATLMRIFAVALDLPEHYFDSAIVPPNAVL